MSTSKSPADILREARHSWQHGARYNVCVRCGLRYRRGFASKVYEKPNGELMGRAGSCNRAEQEELK